MIAKPITLEQTYALRLKVLRPGGQLSERHFQNDGQKEEFHLGVYSDDELICIGSFYPENHDIFPDRRQYRLRGMATDPAHQGKGAGGLLLARAFEDLKERGITLLWCNARIRATAFYERAGFSIHGWEFDVPGIGPHHLMHVRLAPQE